MTSRPHGEAINADPVLKVRGMQVALRNRGRTVRAVRDVSFYLQRGEVLGVVGESGSGKSILMKSVMGLTSSYPGAAVEGAIDLLGQRIDGLSKAERQHLRGRQIAMIFQDPMTALDPLMRVGGQVAEAVSVHEDVGRAEARARAVAILREAELPDTEKVMDAYPHELSGGMRQRVLIAMALVCSPPVLIADEPTTALDVTTQARIVGLLRRLRERHHMSVVFVTHDIALLLRISDRIMVMYAGQVVEVGAAAELYARPRHPYTAALLQASPRFRAPGQRLVAIEGNPPDLGRPVAGCAFAPRCPYVLDRCRTAEPALEPEQRWTNRWVRCWLDESRREDVLPATKNSRVKEAP